VHLIEFRQIVRDAEIAYAISPVVRRHRFSAEETEKFLLALRIPRAGRGSMPYEIRALGVNFEVGQFVSPPS
jgi:hypothetical protein